MKYISVMLFTILALTTGVRADVQVVDGDALIVEYDEFEDVTTCTMADVRDDSGYMFITATQGKHKRCKGDYLLFFVSYISDEPQIHSQKAVFLSKGKRYRRDSYSMSSEAGDGVYIATVSYVFTKKEARRFLRHGAKFRLGTGFEGKIDKRTRAILGKFLSTLR